MLYHRPETCPIVVTMLKVTASKMPAMQMKSTRTIPFQTAAFLSAVRVSSNGNMYTCIITNCDTTKQQLQQSQQQQQQQQQQQEMF